MDTNAFECVWNGTDGWVGSDRARGELLPPYESRTALGVAGPEQDARSPMARRGLRQPRPSVSKYDDAVQDAVRAMRADGLTLAVIASRCELPVGTVYHILNRVRRP